MALRHNRFMRASVKPLFLTLLLLAGCSREVRQAEAPATASGEPRDGGRVVRRLESTVSTLNYVLQATEDERQVLSLIYDPLIAFDRELNHVPAIAAKWDVQDRGRTYVLHLDPRATFSDGVPVRATDVVFTLHKILDEESVQFGSWFEGLERENTVAVDDRTVRVVFREARVSQLSAFNIGVMPEHIYAAENFAKTTKVVGSGPYVLKRRERDRSILLERNPNYWREKPHIQEVLFRPVPDDAVAWKALQRGDLDVGRVNNDLWFSVRDEPAVKSKIDFLDIHHFSYNAIVWNLSDPMLDDARVRRALAMSFDRQTVIENLYRGQARPVTGPFTPDQSAANPAIVPIEFNLPAAAALLGSAGWNDADKDGVRERDGKRFQLTLLVPAGNKASAEQSQVFQEALSRIGVALEITPLDNAAFFDRVMKRNFQAAFLAWVNEPEPDPYPLFHSSQTPPNGLNVVGYANKEADALMEQARTETDSAYRTSLRHNLHEILARDQPYLWTVQVGTKWAVNRRIRNVESAKGLGLFHWQPGPTQWWVTE
jgi:peptide/nickel transport system substrate-binding protein